jgi:uncharacterized protein
MSEPLVGSDRMEQSALLENADKDRRRRGLDDYFIVDADFHQVESDSWAEMIQFVENDVVRQFLQSGLRYGGKTFIPAEAHTGVIQDVAGRIMPYETHTSAAAGGAEREARAIRATMDALGVDYTLVFPTELLFFGTNPFVGHDLETPITRAHARWMTELLLPRDEGLKTMLCLPFRDPEACVRLVEEFGDCPGVVGFMVTAVRNEPTYHKSYTKLYRAIEERGMVLGFHTAFSYHERSMEQLNRFISIHSLGFPYYHMIQTINWIINGMPERFPKLKVLFVEGGLAWIPFVMERLDHEYRMRPSEAPLLKRLPSEYMREFFYTSQPLESAYNRPFLEVTLDMIDARNQLVYASDWPHWDFDLPGRILDIPFLDEDAKRRILGENAGRIFNLSPPARRNGATRQPQPAAVSAA